MSGYVSLNIPVTDLRDIPVVFSLCYFLRFFSPSLLTEQISFSSGVGRRWLFSVHGNLGRLRSPEVAQGQSTRAQCIRRRVLVATANGESLNPRVTSLIFRENVHDSRSELRKLYCSWVDRYNEERRTVWEYTSWSISQWPFSTNDDIFNKWLEKLFCIVLITWICVNSLGKGGVVQYILPMRFIIIFHLACFWRYKSTSSTVINTR